MSHDKENQNEVDSIRWTYLLRNTETGEIVNHHGAEMTVTSADESNKYFDLMGLPLKWIHIGDK